MTFNESNALEQMILDTVENLGRTTAAFPTPIIPRSCERGATP